MEIFIYLFIFKMGQFLTNYVNGEISKERKHNEEGERTKSCKLAHKFRIIFVIRHDSLVITGKKTEHKTQI